MCICIPSSFFGDFNIETHTHTYTQPAPLCLSRELYFDMDADTTRYIIISYLSAAASGPAEKLCAIRDFDCVYLYVKYEFCRATQQTCPIILFLEYRSFYNHIIISRRWIQNNTISLRRQLLWRTQTRLKAVLIDPFTRNFSVNSLKPGLLVSPSSLSNRFRQSAAVEVNKTLCENDREPRENAH